MTIVLEMGQPPAGAGMVTSPLVSTNPPMTDMVADPLIEIPNIKTTFPCVERGR